MKHQNAHFRRVIPIIGIIAAVFPLLAEENICEFDECDQSECIQPSDCNEVLSQNQLNRISKDCESSNHIFLNIVKYRLFGEGDEQRYEEVILHSPTYKNGSTIVPFYPFDFDAFDGASPQPISIDMTNRTNVSRIPDGNTQSESVNQSSTILNTTLNQEEFNDTFASINASDVDDGSDVPELVAVDYASKSAGALVLDASPNFQGTSNLLQKDRDKYAIVPCDEAVKYVIIGLSEDILVKQFAIANYERYSSHMKEIRLYGSTSTTAIRNINKWIDLGTFTTSTNKSYGSQNFFLAEPTWARYLKVEFLSHHGDEFYCTVSQISVHGSTVLQGFHEQWNEDRHDDEVDDTDSVVTEASSTSDEVESSTNDVESASQDNLFSVGNDSKVIREDESYVELKDCEPRMHPSFGSAACIQLSEHKCYDPSSFDKKMAQFISRNLSDSVCRDINVLQSVRSFDQRKRLLSKSELLRLPKRKSISGFEVAYSKNKASLVLISKSKGAETSEGSRFDIGSGSFWSIKRVKEMLRTALGGVKTGEVLKNWHATRILSEKKNDLLSTDEKPRSQSASLSDVGGKRSDISSFNDDNVEEIGAMLAKVLTRLPSAKCLENLNFAEFKLSSKASSTKTRNGSSSSGGSNSASNMEPIFKKLSDEIKSLQSNVAIHDQFAKLSVSCYQRVMLELLLEMESDRRLFDGRVSKLENDLQFGSNVIALQRCITWLFWSIMHLFYWVFMMLVHQVRRMGFSTTSVVRLGLVFVCFVVGTYSLKRSRRSYGIYSTSHVPVNDDRRNEPVGNILPDISFRYGIQAVSEDEEDSLVNHKVPSSSLEISEKKITISP